MAATKKRKAKARLAPPLTQDRETPLEEQAKEPQDESVEEDSDVSPLRQHQPLAAPSQLTPPRADVDDVAHIIPPPSGASDVRLSQLVIAAGTYEGVVAGWEWVVEDERSLMAATHSGASSSGRLKIRFASPVHSGSVRSLSLKDGSTAALEHLSPSPGLLVSCGYDDRLSLHDFAKRVMGCGEVRTPPEWGAPVASAWAPPQGKATHCLVGFSGGPLVLYSSKDWSIQHVMGGHGGSGSAQPNAPTTSSNDATAPSTRGISSLAVHPSGKLALTGGTADGKLMLWDLTKGRLAHTTKVAGLAAATAGSGPKAVNQRHRPFESIASVVWGTDVDGTEVYAFAHGSHATVRTVSTGRYLLDVELPSRINQIALLSNPHGLFAVAACNDGSLPVLAVRLRQSDAGDDDDDDESAAPERRAVLAIEPVDAAAAGEERFKCVCAISPHHVVTATSAGVVSVMDLRGAVRMLVDGDDDESDEDESNSNGEGRRSSEKNNRTSDADTDSDEEDEEELAVDIVDSVRLGSGARITCLAAWTRWEEGVKGALPGTDPTLGVVEAESLARTVHPSSTSKRSRANDTDSGGLHPPKGTPIDATGLATARKLVDQAKKIQRKRQRRQKEKQDS